MITYELRRIAFKAYHNGSPDFNDAVNAVTVSVSRRSRRGSAEADVVSSRQALPERARRRLDFGRGWLGVRLAHDGHVVE